MKALIISGSRNSGGQTAEAVAGFIEGVGEAGGQCEQFFLPKMRIESCRQCEDDGWGICRSEGRCVIDDDLAEMIVEIKAADAVVFATPVYFSDLSESIRSFLDRFRRTCVNESGREGVEGKPAVGICVAGGSGGGAPMCAVSLERVLATCGFDVVDMVAVKRQNLDMKRETLKIVGKWVASLSME